MVDETKERILAAALELFSERGFATAGTKAIAALAGVNEVTVFRLFGSKRALYIEVYRRFSIIPSEMTILADLRGDAAGDLLSIADAIVSVFIRNDKIVRMSFKHINDFPEIDRELRTQPEKLIVLVTEHLRRFSESCPLVEDPARLARTFVTALMGSTLHLLRFSDEKAARAFAADFSGIFYRGILG